MIATPSELAADLFRAANALCDAGQPEAAARMEQAARIVHDSARREAALEAATDLLRSIEAGTCSHPGYDAGTWLLVHA